MKQLLALAALVGLLSVAAPNKGGGLIVHGVRWQTEFESAVTQAKESGKPILHLQSFGRPGDPMACTNTRTLTATLLKDPEIIELMKGTVPSWELVREAAKVTIDFGGGKILHRTLRGNTCLYVLKPDGTVVDAFPGVYEPARLLPELKKSLAMASKSSEEIQAWHRAEAARYPAPRGFGRAVAASKAVLETPILTAPATEARAAMPTNMNPAEAAFRSAAARLFDVSTVPMSPLAARDVSNVNDQATPAQKGQQLLQAETNENLGPVRGVVHLWLASLKAPITAPEAKQTMFETILHLKYTDPFMGLKDVALPGSEN